MKRSSLWQDMTVLHQNRLPGRTTSFPFPDEAAALRGERSLSDAYLCLNGVWQFYYAADGVLPKGICQGGEEENVTSVSPLGSRNCGVVIFLIANAIALNA